MTRGVRTDVERWAFMRKQYTFHICVGDRGRAGNGQKKRREGRRTGEQRKEAERKCIKGVQIFEGTNMMRKLGAKC